MQNSSLKYLVEMTPEITWNFLLKCFIYELNFLRFCLFQVTSILIMSLNSFLSFKKLVCLNCFLGVGGFSINFLSS